MVLRAALSEGCRGQPSPAPSLLQHPVSRAFLLSRLIKASLRSLHWRHMPVFPLARSPWVSVISEGGPTLIASSSLDPTCQGCIPLLSHRKETVFPTRVTFTGTTVRTLLYLWGGVVQATRGRVSEMEDPLEEGMAAHSSVLGLPWWLS